eukprot:8547737-Ditylum_brightwellii.AAC.1
MDCRETKELATSTLWGPPRNILAFVETWLEYIDRVSPDMCSLQEGVRNGCLGEQLKRSQTMAMLGNMIVEKCCVVERKGP